MNLLTWLFLCAFLGGMVGENFYVQNPVAEEQGVMIGLVIGMIFRAGYLWITGQRIITHIDDSHIDFSDGSWK